MPSLTGDRQMLIDADDAAGLLIGEGTTYRWLMSNGLLDAPEPRQNEIPRPQAHGVFMLGQDWLAERIVELSVGIADDYGEASYQTALDDLKAAMVPRDENIAISFRYNGAAARRFYGRPRGVVLPADEAFGMGLATAHLRFIANDPRMYDDTLTQQSSSPAETTGGLGFPFGFPFGFGSATAGGLTANNAGNLLTYPIARVTAGVGGLTAFTVRNETTGELISIVLTMNEADYVEIDFDQKTILLNGSASRIDTRQLPESTWWGLLPGDNEITFTTSGGAAGTLLLSFRSAWL